MADENVETDEQIEPDVQSPEVAEVEAAEETEDEKSEEDLLKDEIGIAVEEVGTLRKKLTITVPRESIDRRLGKQYDELSQDATVPGFRRGRAPRKLIEKRFGHDVGDQLVTELVGQAYLAATEKENLKSIGDPLIWIKPKKSEDGEAAERLVSVQEALETIELPSEGELTFACEIEVRPEFELPKLEGIALKRPKIEISDDDVTEQVNRLRSTRGNWEPVFDGKVEADDLLVVDVKLTAAGETIFEEENAQVAARAQRVGPVVFEKLGEALVGQEAGAECTLEGTLPDDYEREALRGKPAQLAIKVHDIKRLSLPALDAEFLGSLGFDTEGQLRELIRNQLAAKLDQAIAEGLRGQVQHYLLENTKLELPEAFSSRQADRAVVRRMLELNAQGVPQAEIDKHLDELRTGATEQVSKELKLQFIMDRIAEDREVNITEEELNAQIAGIAQQYNRRFDRVRDDLAKGDGLSMLYVRLRDSKILDQMAQQAEITEVTREEAESDKKKRGGDAKTKAKSKSSAGDGPKKKAKADKPSDAG